MWATLKNWFKRMVKKDKLLTDDKGDFITDNDGNYIEVD